MKTDNPTPSPEVELCDDGKDKVTPRLPCIVCGVPLSDKTPGVQEWSFTSQESGAKKSGLCHEFCVATMETILGRG